MRGVLLRCMLPAECRRRLCVLHAAAAQQLLCVENAAALLLTPAPKWHSLTRSKGALRPLECSVILRGLHACLPFGGGEPALVPLLLDMHVCRSVVSVGARLDGRWVPAAKCGAWGRAGCPAAGLSGRCGRGFGPPT